MAYGAPQVFIPRDVPDTPRQWLGDLNSLHRGKRRRITTGSHISDLAMLGKTVCLCEDCSRKWDARPYHYVKASRPPFHMGVNAFCDACKIFSLCSLFLMEGY